MTEFNSAYIDTVFLDRCQ